MSLGSSYTTPLLAITNAMLTGNISLSKLASGTIGQIITVNALGNPVYGSLTLNNLPYGTSNQFLQSTGISNNVWTTMSGDATLSSGVLTVGTDALDISKLKSAQIASVNTVDETYYGGRYWEWSIIRTSIDSKVGSRRA